MRIMKNKIMALADMQKNEEFMNLFELTSEKNEEGAVARREFAEALRLPLNKELPVMNYARTLFDIEYLGPDGQASYEFDADPIDAWFLPRIGSAPQNLIGVTEIFVPCFEVTSSVEWKLQLARQRRFSEIQARGLKLKNAIIRLENEAAWSLIDAVVAKQTPLSVDGEAGLTKKVLNAGFKEMESRGEGYRVKYIVVNARRAGDIRDWTTTELDDTTLREIWKEAGLGNIWGADIIIDQTGKVGDNEAYFFSDNIGPMPIRGDFETFDDPTAIRQYRQRVLAYEEIGLAVFDEKRILKVTIS